MGLGVWSSEFWVGESVPAAIRCRCQRVTVGISQWRRKRIIICHSCAGRNPESWAPLTFLEFKNWRLFWIYCFEFGIYL